LRFLLLTMCLGGSPATLADTWRITAVAGHPDVFRWVRMIPEAFTPALDRELARLGHRMVIDERFGGAIAGVGEELETVGSGLAEIGICSAVFDPAKLALQNITYYTPFVSDDPIRLGEVIDALHRDDPRMTAAYAEHGVTYLGAPVLLDDYLLMTTAPVSSLDDLQGLRIAAPGPAVNWLSGTGAVGVSGNLTTYYNEIRTGVYDGVLVFATAALPGKLHQVAPHIAQVGLGAQFAAALCANVDWFARLPDDVRQALADAAHAASRWYRTSLTSAAGEALDTMVEEGASLHRASDRMRADWAAAMDDAAGRWVDELERRGLPAAGFLAAYMEAMRAAGATPVRDWDR